MTRSIINKNKKKKALVALSLAFVSTFSMGLFSGCGSNVEKDKTGSTTTKTDKETIANGNFEYYTDDEDLKLIVSPSSWSKSVGTDRNSNSASSSTKDSGIINTEKSHWENLTKGTGKYKEGMSIKEVTEAWEDMNANDRLSFYKAITDGKYKTSDSISSLSDFELYTDYKYSIDIDDVPDCENPGTHDKGVYTAKEEETDTDTSVLMIHNYRTDGYGTAQKYTSSTTITVAANTSATFSVWVKTSNLTYNNGSKAEGNRGAYIGVTHTVGSATLDQMQIKNINTSSVTENNGWQQYTVYLRGSSYADSTFTIVLGLGQGSSTNRYENVMGYAFFDDVTCKKITNEDYEKAVAELNENAVCSTFSNETDKFFNVSDEALKDEDTFAIDLYQHFDDLDLLSTATTDIDLTKDETINGEYYTTSGEHAYKGLGLKTDKDYTAIASAKDLASVDNSYLSTIVKKDFASFPFGEDEKVLMLMSANGAAYTAEMKSDEFVLQPKEHKMISFWAKTSELTGYTGATVKLVDGEAETVIGAFDTTNVKKIDIDDQKDLYDGWVQCFYFVENATEEEQNFSLKFCYGPTTITGSSKNNYIEGFAAFTNFRLYDMNATEYSYAAATSYAKKASLVGGSSKTTSSGFDSPIYSNQNAIENGLATPLTYQGVTGGSNYLVKDGDECLANTNENAGLINRNYADNYFESDSEWMKELLVAAAKDTSLTAALDKSNWWASLFGTSTQPLLIVNAVEQSYGYIAKSSANLTASSYTSIATKVTVGPGAIAYVYLIDTSSLEDGYEKNIKIETPAITYWYDDDGNVCKGDPTDEDFNEKTDILYYVNDNGLYVSADKNDTNLYANLKAYKKAYEQDAKKYSENTQAGKNLVTASGKIVYYYNEADDSYYAQHDVEKDAYLLKVTDLSTVIDAKYVRYTSESRDLYTVIDNREGTTTISEIVSYYIATGDKSVKYRLEVFSGSRDGKVTSKAGSFVAFDSVKLNSLSSSYDNLLKETLAAIDEDKTNGITLDKESGRLVKEDGSVYENATYYTYTFYDSNAYLRYDSVADPSNNYVLYDNSEEDPGNLYSGYQQSDYSEQLVYLKDGYTTYVNYSAIDTTVTPDSVHDHDHDDEDEKAEFNVDSLLLIVSISFSAILIAVIFIIGARRIIKDIRKKKVIASSSAKKVYNQPRKMFKRVNKEETAEEKKPEPKKPVDANDPYEGENN